MTWLVVTVYIICLLFIFAWPYYIVPRLGLVTTLEKKTLIVPSMLSYVFAWIMLTVLSLYGDRYAPPKNMINAYYEGYLKYIDSGKTQTHMGARIQIRDKNGVLNGVTCYVANKLDLKKGAIPCGYDKRAREELNGQYGRVWYYNDFDKNSPMDHTRILYRAVATQIILGNGKEYPYEIQKDVIEKYILNHKCNPFGVSDAIEGIIFIIFFIVAYTQMISKSIKIKEEVK